ncbi:glycosyltransferase [Cognatilysobacter segetis]|uniref:glycosyltransferase n=1 Tax=Cognatilysobacter segetis TaxID=2492394 RepID=UPI00105FFE56|nr:glycosyltransferase [Lysobacter segetis]
MRDVWFHRRFHGYSGGHGKVFDYFGHVAAHPAFRPRLFLTPDSVDTDNPWRRAGVAAAEDWHPDAADVLFLGGMDWTAVPDDLPQRPVINLVQHVRHADPDGPLIGFLSRRAIRICVSQPVAAAIASTSRVNGPVLAIEAGLALPDVERGSVAPGRVFIAAAKQPEIGTALAAALVAQGRDVDLCIEWTSRAEFLRRLAAAERAVMLPFATEGFFLPGLEAMSLGIACVVPDCVGNRDYLEPGVNALSPDMRVEALLDAVVRLDAASVRGRLAAAGTATAERFSLTRERAAFHAVLDRLDSLWTS